MTWTPALPYVYTDSTVAPTIAYVAHHYGVDDPNSLAHDVVHTLDLTTIGIPIRAVAIFARAKVVITNSSNREAELRAYVGKAGDSMGHLSWEIHAIANPHDGTRQGQTMLVPVADGKVDFRWRIENGPDPDQSYGLVLMTNAYYLQPYLLNIESSNAPTH